MKGSICERDLSAARVIQISMDCKCFKYCDKKASLIEKEPVCLKMAPPVSSRVNKGCTQMCGACVGTQFH